MSEMAGLLRIGLAKYSEIENGIGAWLTSEYEQKLARVLSLNDVQAATFRSMVDDYRESKKLKFSDVFSKRALAPARLRHMDGRNVTPKERQEILDSVFIQTV